MAIEVGQVAPDFTLWNQDKQQVTLSALKGKNVLLAFFPLAFTGTCTKELCSLRDTIKTYEDLNAEVYGISVDSIFSLGKFRAEQNLNFPLLSDFNKEASKAFDCLYDTFVVDMKGVSKRSAFVIDKEGIVRYAEVLETPTDIPNFDAIKQCLEAIK